MDESLAALKRRRDFWSIVTLLTIGLGTYGVYAAATGGSMTLVFVGVALALISLTYLARAVKAETEYRASLAAGKKDK